MPKIKPSKLIMAVVIVIALIATGWYFFKPEQQPTQYITAEVTQGDIENSVLATGVLEATKMVSVGAQVSGQVKKMYVQLGDQVKQGQLIARIDSVRQENDLKTAEASIKNQMAQHAGNGILALHDGDAGVHHAVHGHGRLSESGAGSSNCGQGDQRFLHINLLQGL